MSEKEAPSLNFESTEERVEHLAQLFRDIDDDYAALEVRLNAKMRELLEYQESFRKSFEAEVSAMRVEINKTLAELRERFDIKVQEQVNAVTAEEIASALSKRVLVTRSANREELKSTDTLVVRQATAAEIRTQPKK